jgi:hypothetical protein
MERIFVLGYPGNMGGANTECWHTVKLWREAGWPVTLVPTWRPNEPYRLRLDSIGAETQEIPGPEKLPDVPGLANSIVVGFCNSHFQTSIPMLRRLNCRLIWVNCMTFSYPQELGIIRRHGPADAYVFQSEFQRRMLEAVLTPLGYNPDTGHLIRGAFDLSEFPFAPRAHAPGEPFIVGRLSRPDSDKWSSNTWSIYGGIPYEERRALVMGWNVKLQKKLGRPPKWAETLAPQAIGSVEFLGRCHCLLPINGGARENWPRVGLEAMAAGVPIVAQNEWGWPEMIVHGETGFLGSNAAGDNDKELQFYAALLAYEEPRRLAIVEAARARVEELVDPAPIVAGWQRLFDGLGISMEKIA